jgi:hypothetical protein
MTVQLFSSVHGVSRRQLRGSVLTSRLAGDGAVELSGRREVLERTAGLLADAALALAAGTTDQSGRHNPSTPRPFLSFGVPSASSAEACFVSTAPPSTWAVSDSGLPPDTAPVTRNAASA